MQQGAQSAPTSAGAQRQPNARRGRRRGTKRKGRRRRRRNPSPATWILIAGGTAVAVGGVAAYALNRRRKRQDVLLPTNGNGPLPGGGGVRPGGGGGGGAARINAPQFPHTEAVAQGVEGAWVTTVLAESGQTSFSNTDVNRLTDLVFDEVYGTDIRIPAAGQRGSGWQPFIDAWFRIRELLRFSIRESGGSIS